MPYRVIKDLGEQEPPFYSRSRPVPHGNNMLVTKDLEYCSFFVLDTVHRSRYSRKSYLNQIYLVFIPVLNMSTAIYLLTIYHKAIVISHHSDAK